MLQTLAHIGRVKKASYQISNDAISDETEIQEHLYNTFSLSFWSSVHCLVSKMEAVH